jgi:hypothetical protein
MDKGHEVVSEIRARRFHEPAKKFAARVEKFAASLLIRLSNERALT